MTAPRFNPSSLMRKIPIPPIPSSGLRITVAVFRMKGSNRGCAPSHQRRSDQGRKLHDRQLFRVVTQGTWLVENPGSLPFGLAQQMSRIKVFRVERRIFPHEHRVEAVERHAIGSGLAVVPVIGLARKLQPHAARCADRSTRQPLQVRHLAEPHGVAPTLRLTHHCESGVLVDHERVERIRDKKDLHGASSVFKPVANRQSGCGHLRARRRTDQISIFDPSSTRNCSVNSKVGCRTRVGGASARKVFHATAPYRPPATG